MTKTAVRYLLLCLLVVAMAACAGTGAGARGAREMALRADLEVLPLPDENVTLVADLAAPGGSLSVHSVTLTSRHVIVEDAAGRLYAVDRESLMPAWHYYGLPRPLDFALYEAAGSYLMVTANTLFQIEKTTGAELGVFRLDFTPSSPPAGNDSTAYIGAWSSPAGNKTLYSVNLADGMLGWGYRSMGHVTSQPIVHGAPRQLVYFADHDEKIYALEARGAFDGAPSPAWMQQTFGPNTADLVLSGDLLLVASEEGVLYALDRATGNRKWAYTSGQPIKATPAATANAVYFANEYGFHCLDRAGNLLWQLKDGSLSFLLERDGNTWVRHPGGGVQVFETKTGEPVDAQGLGGWFLPANEQDGTFYAVSPCGFVFAYTQRLQMK